MSSSISDHFLIYHITQNHVMKADSVNAATRFQINQQNLSNFVHDLRTTQWDSITSIDDPNSAFYELYATFMQCFHYHFPLVKSRKNCMTPVDKPWIDNMLKDMITEKDKLYQKFKRNPNEFNISKYKRYHNHLYALIK